MQVMVLTQRHILQKDKYWWTAMFEMNDIKIKKTQDKQVEQPFVEHWENHYRCNHINMYQKQL